MSLKISIISQIRRFLEDSKREYNQEFRVEFLTSIGRIHCDVEPLAHTTELIGYLDDPENVVIDVSAIFGDNSEFDSQLINAKNVVLYKNNSDEILMTSKQIILFVDRILGFSIVKKR